MAWMGTKKKSITVGVVGIGYVGLPLMLQFWRTGNKAIGFDLDESKVKDINEGRSYIRHVDGGVVHEARRSGRILATTDFKKICEVDAIIICVPTPLAKHREPDIQSILSAGKSIAPHIKAGHLVILESTTYPGTTDGDLKPLLEGISKLKAGKDFHLAFSPEREDPGNVKFKTADIPKVVGGLTQRCADAAMDLYGRAGIPTVPVSSCGAAEATKLVENTFRMVNIAMVNELKMAFDKMGIDIWEVIDAAKTKPFGFMPFYPGPGLGGHCIPIDPFYLTWKAREFGASTQFIELAGDINEGMQKYVTSRLLEALSDRRRHLKGSRILLLGVAYKKNVDDVRESPAFRLWELLVERGAKVDYHDPYVPAIPSLREHPEYAGIQSVEVTAQSLSKYTAVIVVTDHSGVDYKSIVRHSRIVLDTRNACAGISSKKIIKS